jgi:hypothetical protein
MHPSSATDSVQEQTSPGHFRMSLNDPKQHFAARLRAMQHTRRAAIRHTAHQVWRRGTRSSDARLGIAALGDHRAKSFKGALRRTVEDEAGQRNVMKASDLADEPRYSRDGMARSANLLSLVTI